MDIFAQLRRDEDCKLKPYKDSVGKLTIGIGRNLDDVGISEDEAEYLLTNDVKKVASQLDIALPWYINLDEIRKGVLLNMAFNMGINGLLGFKNTLNHIANGNYDIAAQEMLQSKWATQVGARATRLSKQMLTGIWQ